MILGKAYQEWLTPREQKALAASCDMLIDIFFYDWDLFAHWKPKLVDKTMLRSYLPSRYLSHYTPAFFKKFAVCVITVAWKLAQPNPLPLSSVAEELAAWAIINQAKVLLEIERDKEALTAADNAPTTAGSEREQSEGSETGEGEDFERFMDCYFDDQDFLFLFMDGYDGVDSSEAGRIAGMTSLSFQDWFRPFSDEPERIAHPYTWNE
jgi:hypothetical protein